MEVHQSKAEPWKITLVDTGINTMTGGRIRRIKHYVDDTFFLTYGDGVGDININRLLIFIKRIRRKLQLLLFNHRGVLALCNLIVVRE